MTYILWIVQVVLALLFLFAGGTKLVLPLEVLTVNELSGCQRRLMRSRKPRPRHKVCGKEILVVL